MLYLKFTLLEKEKLDCRNLVELELLIKKKI